MFNQVQCGMSTYLEFPTKCGRKKVVDSKTNVSLLGILIYTDIMKHLYSSWGLGKFIFCFQNSKIQTCDSDPVFNFPSLYTWRKWIIQRTLVFSHAMLKADKSRSSSIVTFIKLIPHIKRESEAQRNDVRTSHSLYRQERKLRMCYL